MKQPVLFGNGSPVGDWFQTIAVNAPLGASITVSGGGETLTATGTGSYYALDAHNKSTTYTITATIDGVSAPSQTVTTGTAAGVISFIDIAFGTINLTYANDFRGTTITCANGGTTISKTAPSGGNTMAFYPPNTGTWVISGEVGGTPYSTNAEVTSLSTPVSAELATVPIGSTVLPTDDIQIWLNCAGIYDKTSYTTLEDVLADHDTLATLISNNNAVDYMVRSTTWATDVTADETAMRYIGKRNYAADECIADNDWNTAILSSDYKTFVYNSGGGTTRTDVDESLIDIYSAANDTVTITPQGGGASLTVVTDSAGHGTIARSNLPAGTYTFASSVAKNPDNLSNYYSKTVTVDANEIEVCVMPDEDILYWFGYKSHNLESLSTENGWTFTSSYTFVAPAYNTNDITETSATSQIVGVGTKIKMSGTVKILGESVSSSTGSGDTRYYSVLEAFETKNISGAALELAYMQSANPIPLTLYTMNLATEGYIEHRTTNARANKISALWVE